MRKTLILAIALYLIPTVARADDRATTKDAERMVHDAVTFIKKEGKEKAFATFNDPKGAFSFRDLYIAVYDPKGKCLAHGAKKDRVGKNLIDDKDADGKLFVKERMELAKSKGKGWQDYKFLNPATKQVEQKVAYFEMVDGVVVVCGAYKP
ncbi:MAG TPA: cache domain-containing protein [Polyangia bacterium]